MHKNDTQSQICDTFSDCPERPHLMFLNAESDCACGFIRIGKEKRDTENNQDDS